MNPLIDKYPESVTIDDKEYILNTDYRVALKIILAFEDPELADYEKQNIALHLLYKTVPENLEKACEMATWFLDCGEQENLETDNVSYGRLYSFSKDAKYILSAINQANHTDIEMMEHLHWWKFNIMFIDIHETSFFSRLIYLRKQFKRGKLTKEEREAYFSLGTIAEIDEVYTEQEQSVFKKFEETFNKHPG